MAAPRSCGLPLLPQFDELGKILRQKACVCATMSEAFAAPHLVERVQNGFRSTRVPSHSAKLAYAHDHCVFGSTYLRRYDDAVPRRRMDVANGSNCPRWRLHFCGRFVARTRVDQMK